MTDPRLLEGGLPYFPSGPVPVLCRDQYVWFSPAEPGELPRLIHVQPTAVAEHLPGWSGPYRLKIPYPAAVMANYVIPELEGEISDPPEGVFTAPADGLYEVSADGMKRIEEKDHAEVLPHDPRQFPPEDPEFGWRWTNTDDGIEHEWNGEKWVPIGVSRNCGLPEGATYRKDPTVTDILFDRRLTDP